MRDCFAVAAVLAMSGCQEAFSPNPMVDKSVRPQINVYVPENPEHHGRVQGRYPSVEVDVKTYGAWWSHTNAESSGDSDQSAEGEASPTIPLNP